MAIAASALMVLVLAGAYTVQTSVAHLERTHGARAVETADIILGQMGANVAARMDQIVRATRNGIVRLALNEANERRGGPPLVHGFAVGTRASRTLRDVFMDYEQRVFGRTVFAAVLLTDRRGWVVADTGPSSGPVDLSGAAWWTAARDNGRHVSEVEEGTGPLPPGLGVAVRLDDENGRMIGVARAVLSVAWITREAALATQLRHPVDILLTTGDGKLVFSRLPFRFLEDVSDRPFFQAMTEPRGFATVTIGSRSRLVAYTANPSAPAIGPLDWTLFILADREAVLKDLNTLRRRLLILLALITLATAVGTAILARSFLRPLSELREAARAMADGDLSVRVGPKGRDELTDLGLAFNSMADRLQANEATLRNLAATDALTGVPNRRGFMARAAAEWDRRRRYGAGLSVLVLDIDHFKRINDIHGHDIGDDVLVHVAAICRDGVRTSDLFGRLGGEEFAAILPEAGIDAAKTLAERLREAVVSRPCPCGDMPITVSVSIGVAVVGEADGSFEAVLKRADEALYAAKRAGRNRVEVAA